MLGPGRKLTLCIPGIESSPCRCFLQLRQEARRGDDDQNSMDSKSLSRRFSVFAEILDEGEDDEEYEGQEKVQWKYSDYMTALDREQQLLNGDDRASSILSGQCCSVLYLGELIAKSGQTDWSVI